MSVVYDENIKCMICLQVLGRKWLYNMKRHYTVWYWWNIKRLSVIVVIIIIIIIIISVRRAFFSRCTNNAVSSSIWTHWFTMWCQMKARCKDLTNVELFKSLEKNKYLKLRSFACSVEAMFATTYVCEKSFATMKIVKTKFWSRQTNTFVINYEW